MNSGYSPIVEKIFTCLSLTFFLQELYTGSSDRQILVWSPPKNAPVVDQASRHMIFFASFSCILSHVPLTSKRWEHHQRIWMPFLGFFTLCSLFSSIVT